MSQWNTISGNKVVPRILYETIITNIITFKHHGHILHEVQHTFPQILLHCQHNFPPMLDTIYAVQVKLGWSIGALHARLVSVIRCRSQDGILGVYPTGYHKDSNRRGLNREFVVWSWSKFHPLVTVPFPVHRLLYCLALSWRWRFGCIFLLAEPFKFPQDSSRGLNRRIPHLEMSLAILRIT